MGDCIFEDMAEEELGVGYPELLAQGRAGAEGHICVRHAVVAASIGVQSATGVLAARAATGVGIWRPPRSAQEGSVGRGRSSAASPLCRA